MAETPDLSGYDIIFVGFPVWWGREPSIIDTFLESNDLTGKTGITGVEKAAAHIRGILGSGVTVEDGRRLGADGPEEEIRTWTELLKF